jgi:hypothetical protein
MVKEIDYTEIVKETDKRYYQLLDAVKSLGYDVDSGLDEIVLKGREGVNIFFDYNREGFEYQVRVRDSSDRDFGFELAEGLERELNLEEEFTLLIQPKARRYENYLKGISKKNGSDHSDETTMQTTQGGHTI